MCRSVFCFLLTVGIVHAGPRTKTVSLKQARELVSAALPSWALKLRNLAIDPYEDAYSPDFYYFFVWHPVPEGSGTVGQFAVDPMTGDVWNGVLCEEYTTAALSRLQISVRKQLGLSDKDYRRLKRLGPTCASK